MTNTAASVLIQLAPLEKRLETWKTQWNKKNVHQRLLLAITVQKLQCVTNKQSKNDLA